MSINRSVVFSFASQAPTIVFSFLAGVCITRLLGEEGRGVFTTLQADVTILTFLLSVSMPSALVYFLAKGEHPREQVIGFAMSVLLVLVILVGSLMLLIGLDVVNLDRFLPSSATNFFYIFFVGGSLLMAVAQSFLGAIFLGVREFRVGNRMYVISALANLMVYGGLYLTHDGGGVNMIRWVLGGGMVVQFALTGFWVVQYVVYVKVRPRLFSGGALLRPTLAFSAMGYLADLLNQLNYRLDIWILGDMRGMAELGVYAVAVGVAQFFFMVPEPITRVLQPHLVSDDQKDLLSKFRFYSRLCITLVMAGGLVFLVAADWIFPLVYGKAFAASTLPFRLLMPGIVFACVSKMLVLLVVRTGKVKYNALASGLGLVMTVIFDLVLIPVYGPAGAAMASTLSYFTVLCVVLFVIFRRLGVPWDNYFILMPADIKKLLGRLGA